MAEKGIDFTKAVLKKGGTAVANIRGLELNPQDQKKKSNVTVFGEDVDQYNYLDRLEEAIVKFTAIFDPESVVLLQGSSDTFEVVVPTVPGSAKTSVTYAFSANIDKTGIIKGDVNDAKKSEQDIELLLSTKITRTVQPA